MYIWSLILCSNRVQPKSLECIAWNRRNELIFRRAMLHIWNKAKKVPYSHLSVLFSLLCKIYFLMCHSLIFFSISTTPKLMSHWRELKLKWHGVLWIRCVMRSIPLPIFKRHFRIKIKMKLTVCFNTNM